jgi:hypothetical protein
MNNYPLKQGNFSSEVMKLQTDLQKLKYGKFIPTGFFGEKTKQAVILFQKDYGLPQTGEFSFANQIKLNQELLYYTALYFLGRDASPSDLAPDELGCADSVSAILFRAFGHKCGINYTISTSQMYYQLLSSDKWMMVGTPQRGDIIISPTGMGDGRIMNGRRITNGHVGIVGDGELIYSNSSANGIFEQNYTVQTWKDRYTTNGGYPVFYFRKI